MASPRAPESHGSAPPPPYVADDLPLAQSPPPTVSATHGSAPQAPYVRNLHCWSKLPRDLLQMVFERLGFADFQRAKPVCTSWQSASRNPQPNNQIPWMIRFPSDNHNNYCLLFNPEEKHKIYKTQDLGNDFAKSNCVATCRSWLLMQPEPDFELVCNLYILHLLTRERINLPSLVLDYELLFSPVLWIDEKTKDYLVIGKVSEENTTYFKKGDNSWKQIPSFYECFSMVYKNQKLYCLNYYKLKVLDFSGDDNIPLKIFKISVSGCLQRATGLGIRLPGIPFKDQWWHRKNDVVVTVTGDVLIVKSTMSKKIWKFEIYKMDSCLNKWEKIVSLGDEAILLDLGITVLAKDMEGIKRNSIYFSYPTPYFRDQYDENEIFIFNLDSKEVEQPHRVVCSSFPCSTARWFFPSFKRE